MDDKRQETRDIARSRYPYIVECASPGPVLPSLISLANAALRGLGIEGESTGYVESNPSVVGLDDWCQFSSCSSGPLPARERVSAIRLVAGASISELGDDAAALVGADGRVSDYWRMTAYCNVPSQELVTTALCRLVLDPLFTGIVHRSGPAPKGVRAVAVRQRLLCGHLDAPMPSRGRVLWIDANPHVDTVLEPYGLSMLAERSRQFGFQSLTVCPYSEFEIPEDGIEDALNIYRPDLVGLSVRNIDDAVTVRATDGRPDTIDTQFYLDRVKRLVESVRSAHEGPVVVGGSALLRSPEPLMRRLGLRCGVQGPAIAVMSELFAQWYPGARSDTDRGFHEIWQTISGTIDLCASSANSRGRIPRKVENLKRVPRDPAKLRLERRLGLGAALQGSYGCPLDCSYCAEATPNKPVALLSARWMVDEIEWLYDQYGVTQFHMTDSEANLPFFRVREFAEEIIRRRLHQRISWSAYVTPSPFDLEAIPLLCESGLLRLKASIDHFCRNPLRAMGKKHSERQVATFLDGFAAGPYADRLSASILFGSPGESGESISFALARMRQLSSSGILFYYNAGIRIYQGTPLYEEWRSGRLDKDEVFGPGIDDDALAPLVYCHPVPPRQLAEWVEEGTSGCRNVRRIALSRSVQHDRTLRLLNVAASMWYRSDREGALSIIRRLGGIGDGMALARAALQLDRDLRTGRERPH